MPEDAGRHDVVVLLEKLRLSLQAACALPPAAPAALTAHTTTVAKVCHDLAIAVNDDATGAGDAAVAADAIETLVEVFRTFAAHAEPLGEAGLALHSLLESWSADRVSRAKSAGALEGLDAALCAHGADVRVQNICLHILTFLLHEDQLNTSMAGRLGAVEAAVAALRIHGSSGPSSVHIESVAVAIISMLASRDAENRERAHRIDAVPHVLIAMRRWSSDERVQRCACVALSNLLCNSSRTPPELHAGVRVEAGAAAFILEAVAHARRMCADDAVIQHACANIASLFHASRPPLSGGSNEAERDSAAAATSSPPGLGGEATATAAAQPGDYLDEVAQLLQHNDDADALAAVLHAMHGRFAERLNTDSENTPWHLPAVAPATAIVDALLTVMRTHVAHVGVQARGVRLLPLLLHADDGEDMAAAARQMTLRLHPVAVRCLDVVVEAMQAHRLSAAVNTYGCNALLSVMLGAGLSGMREVAAAVGAAGAVEALCAMLRAHSARADLHLIGFKILDLLFVEEMNVQRAARAGVMRLPPVRNADSALVSARNAVMSRLQDAAAAVADAAAAELLASEEAEHAAAAAAHRGGAKSKKRASKNKSGGGAASVAPSAGGGGQAPPTTPAVAAQPDDAAPEDEDANASAAAAADDDAGAAPSSSASAVRRRRRAAAKAVQRSSSASSAHAAAAAEEPQPAPPDEANAASDDDDAAAAAVPAAAPVAMPPPPPAVPAAAQHHGGGGGGSGAAEDDSASTTCVVCLDAPRSTVLLPCKHLALCASPGCAAMLGAPPRCPLCRMVVTDTLAGVFF
jgi:hypothetical protein